MLRHLLVYRLTLLNGVGAAGLAWAWQSGLLGYIGYDTSRISLVIIGVFGLGMASIFHRARKVGKALNAIKAGGAVFINQAKFRAKGVHIETISSVCVGLGFFGTVVGLIAMLFGNGGITSDGSVENITAIIEQILRGGGIAFLTTAVGLVTSLWLEINARILDTATQCMLEDAL